MRRITPAECRWVDPAARPLTLAERLLVSLLSHALRRCNERGL